jgi:hypothetical protein
MSHPVSPESSIRGLSHVALAVREADSVAARLLAAFGGMRGEEEMLD